MEFIQWYVGTSDDPSKPGGEITNITNHAIFRFDAIDKDMMDEATLDFVEDKNKEYWDEVEQWDYADDMVDKNELAKRHLSYRVCADDRKEYNIKCLDIFARLLGFKYALDITLRKDDESLEEFIERAKLEGLGKYEYNG